MKNVSMQKIADELGISKNSVSQALRDTKEVSDELKTEVRRVAEKLGYDYSPHKKKPKGTFAVLATSFALQQASFFGEIIKYLYFYSGENQRDILTVEVTPEMVEHEILPVQLSDYEGVFIVSHISDRYISKIINQNIPTVIIDHHSYKFAADCILTKNTDGAYLATNLLIEHGYKKIGFIGDIDFSPSYKERYRGYVQALTDSDLPLEEKVTITKIKENQGELFNRLKGIETIPEAWFCVNSGLAFMLNYYLQSLGYVIPRDISIICFDETEFNHMAIPSITNVSTDLKYMAQLGVTTLLNRLENPDLPYTHTQIVPHLNILESVKL
ncbi:MAG: substrate-binding domain-containing protein [Streptococcaceae bacterium]|jgi:LacI family transcriptional regulator|nr:substrate-binding domain-containing protein [Streptococcaceae bacterium]